MELRSSMMGDVYLSYRDMDNNLPYEKGMISKILSSE